MTKILIGYLIEHDTDDLIIEKCKFSEDDVKRMVNGINWVDDVSTTYPYASDFSIALLNDVLRGEESKDICTLQEVAIAQIYLAIKEAYYKDRYKENWIGLHILIFFDSANCERNHAYLRFELRII